MHAVYLFFALSGGGQHQTWPPPSPRYTPHDESLGAQGDNLDRFMQEVRFGIANHDDYYASLTAVNEMRMLLTWPVYRFELPYVQPGRTLSKCLVEIYAEGCKPQVSKPVVVITDLPDHMGVCNDIEYVCSVIRREFLARLRVSHNEVQWFLCYNRGTPREEWSKVTFGSLDAKSGQYQDPQWTETRPVHFDWDSLIPDRHYRIERRMLDPESFAADNFQFTPDECFRMRTGACSLEDKSNREHHPGESGYEYCRGLAVSAEVWALINSFYDGEIPPEEQALSDPAVWRFVQDHWTGKVGRLPGPPRMAVSTALRLFGATDISIGIHGGVDDQGKIGLNDGCHRSCVAQRLGITVGAFVEVEAIRAG